MTEQINKRGFCVPNAPLKVVNDRGNREYSSGLEGVFVSEGAELECH